MSARRTILITGCSDGGIGSGLALAFHDAGWRVFASARSLSKLKDTTGKGIESVQLDVTSPESLRSAVSQVSKMTGGSLDALFNNAGLGLPMPLLDVDIQAMRDLFELNVFSVISTIQEFTPLLLRSKANPMVLNNTSVAGDVPVMWQGVYNASKTALSMLTWTLRLELEPLGINVIDLKTGAVQSNIFINSGADTATLPEHSLYSPARLVIEEVMQGKKMMERSWTREKFAKAVVNAVNGKSVDREVWKGAGATMVHVATFLPSFLLGYLTRNLGKSAEVAQKIEESRNDAKGMGF